MPGWAIVLAVLLVPLGGLLLAWLALGVWYVFFSDVVERYPDGTKRAQGAFHSGDMQGLWTYWHRNGRKECEGGYVAGWQGGEWSFWHENGQSRARGVIGDDGRKAGVWQYWDEGGKAIGEAEYVARLGVAALEPERRPPGPEARSSDDMADAAPASPTRTRPPSWMGEAEGRRRRLLVIAAFGILVAAGLAVWLGRS